MISFAQNSFSTESFSVNAFAFDAPPAVVPDSIKWGYGPMVVPDKKLMGKTRQQRQNEVILLALIH